MTHIINDYALPLHVALDNVKRILYEKDSENWSKSLTESDKL